MQQVHMKHECVLFSVEESGGENADGSLYDIPHNIMRGRGSRVCG